MEDQPDLLNEFVNPDAQIRRKKLLPIWIKVFAWIFLVMGAFVPVIIILGILNMHTSLSLYGLETTYLLTPIGIIITVLFSLKAITAFGFIKEMDWAIKLGIIDAALGIAICAFLTIYPIFNSDYKFNFRIELLFLIPFLLKLLKIKSPWENTIQE